MQDESGRAQATKRCYIGTVLDDEMLGRLPDIADGREITESNGYQQYMHFKSIIHSQDLNSMLHTAGVDKHVAKPFLPNSSHRVMQNNARIRVGISIICSKPKTGKHVEERAHPNT